MSYDESTYKTFVHQLFNPKFDDTRIIPWSDGIIIACKLGMKELVEYFLNANYAHISERINDVLWGACFGGNRDIIDLIVFKYGANHFSHGFLGACKGGHLDIAKLMQEYFYNASNLQMLDLESAFQNACESGNRALVLYIFKLGLKIDKNDKNSNTLLRAYELACYKKHFNIARLLLCWNLSIISIYSRSIAHNKSTIPIVFYYNYRRTALSLNGYPQNDRHGTDTDIGHRKYNARQFYYAQRKQQNCLFNVLYHFSTDILFNRFVCFFIGLYDAPHICFF